MKHLLPLVTIFILFLNLKKSDAQVLISDEVIASYTTGQIDSIYSGIGLPSGLLPIIYDVDIHKLIYRTSWPNGDSTIASGALLVPKGFDCALPMASYQHGTVLEKEGVPSRNTSEVLLGMFLATDGFIVSMADYLGLGDSPGLHPYQHAGTEASSAIDMLRASREFLVQNNVKRNEQLFLWGYSQGGHSTMALHQEIETNHSDEFTVTAAAPMSGPYALSGAQTDMLLSDDPYASPAYLPYLLLGWKQIYPDLDSIYPFFKPPYDTMLPPLFDGSYSMGYVNSLMPTVPKLIVDSLELERFIEDSLTHPLRIRLKENDTYRFVPEAPMKMYYCEADEQVVYLNAIEAKAWFDENNIINVEAINSGVNLDHGGCIVPSMLHAKGWIDDLKKEGDIIIELGITGESALNFGDGSAEATVSGGTGTYTYEWSTGSVNSSANGLTSGEYHLTVTDDLGCTEEISFTVGVGTGISTYNSESHLTVFPNPFNDVVTFHFTTDFPGEIVFKLKDIQGRIVGERKAIKGEQIQLDLSHLGVGTYFAEIKTGEIVRRKRITKL